MGAASIYCEHLGTQETTIGVRPEATIAAIIGGVIATVSLPIAVGAMGRKKPLVVLSLVYGPTMAMILVVSHHQGAILAAEAGVAMLLVLSVICHQYALPHDRVNRERRCSECRYDLRGNTTGRCPECGVESDVVKKS